MNLSGANALPSNLLQHGCSNLQKLSIINCSLTKVPTLMMSKASNLSYVDLSMNLFANIKREDFQVTSFVLG